MCVGHDDAGLPGQTLCFCRVFGNPSFRHRLKQLGKCLALPKPAMPGSEGGRVVRLSAKDAHAHDGLRVCCRETGMAVERLAVLPRLGQIEMAIECSQKTVRRSKLFQVNNLGMFPANKFASLHDRPNQSMPFNRLLPIQQRRTRVLKRN